MTWRERIAAARARGRFVGDDFRAWANPGTCFVGEQRERHGLRFDLEMTAIGAGAAFRPDLQTAILEALEGNDFDAAERLLDFVEDRALQLKREAGT